MDSTHAKLAVLDETRALENGFLCRCGEEHELSLWLTMRWDKGFQHVGLSGERRYVFQRERILDRSLHDRDEENEP